MINNNNMSFLYDPISFVFDHDVWDMAHDIIQWFEMKNYIFYFYGLDAC